MKLIMAALLMALPLAAQSNAEGPQFFRLQNGLRVLLLENHQHPLIRLQLRTVWALPEPSEAIPSAAAKGPETKGNPSSQIPPGQTSLESLALGVLGKCSVGHRSRSAFNRAVEERGLSLWLSGEPDGPLWNLSGGSPEVESVFSLLADAVMRPILEGPDLDAVKLRFIHELHEQGSRKNARMDFLHQLERPDLDLGLLSEKNLSQIYLEQLQRFILTTLRPDRAVLAISGDLNLSQARQLAQLNFGTWNEGSDVNAPLVLKLSSSALKHPPMIVPSDQKETIIALPFLALDAKQRAAQDLLSIWLPRSLRPDLCSIYHGAAGWHSLILATEGMEASLRRELLAIKKSGLKTEDLEQAKSLWIAGRRALALHPQEQLSFAAEETLSGLKPSEQEIQAVDLDGFNATLRSWLDLDSARILVLGGN